MVEVDDRRLDVMIALLANLVAANADGDPVLALDSAGMKATEIARILDMKPNAVSMRISRAKERNKKK